MSELKHVLSDIATSPKSAAAATAWGFSMNSITELLEKYINPFIAELTPFLSFILLIMMIALHIPKIRKARAEQAKAEDDLKKAIELSKAE